MFKKVNPRQNFPEMEKEIMKFWEKNKIFEKSVDNNKDEKKIYSFYDGPPFATGLPHYGHIVANLMKDVVPRYWTMRGYKVERRWGWDCHGLPVENLIEKELGIKNKREIEELGIDKFNQACRDSVLRYADDWKKFIPRIGRWVDMENDYKTMDWKYTESIWRVFSELYKKGLVYEGYKSMHICPRCETTLSNFEVTQEYKDITDLSAVVKFKLKAGQKIGDFEVDENTFILAWTTTPWTLPGNVALAVGVSIKYQVVSVKGENEKYILAKDIYDELYDKDDKDSMKLAFNLVYADNKAEGENAVKYPEEIRKFKGENLIGLKYEPLFDYYSKKEDLENREKGWKIYAGDFVTTEEGTGVVHIAPAFGDDDMKLAEKYKLPFVQHVGMDGRFTKEVVDLREKSGLQKGSTALRDYGTNDTNLGREVKPKRNPRETDEKIVEWLEENNKLFSKENYKHSYPHCWRCDTPLLNYATSSWFVEVTAIKKRMIKNNQEINWTPKYIKDGRFGRWLEEARDWAISRSRFWGAPLPIWRCEKCKNIEVINSIDDLRNKTSQKITKFIILRHGESESNVLKIRASGSNKYGLTEKGIKQSEAAAEELKKQEIDIFVTSPILRARQTAKIVNKKLKMKVVENDLVREYNFGKWDGCSEEDLLGKDKLYQKVEELKRLGRDKKRYNFAFGGDGESRQDVENRIRKFVGECVEKYPGKNILVVCHGGVNAIFNRVLNGASMGKVFKIEPLFKNAEQSVFYADEKGGKFDLHKPNIDKIKIKCPKCGGEAKIIGDVFDCWFESGSMPYAQYHYPFENKDKFAKSFPANFIAEGLDQTRGWFYTLIVLSSALFNKPAFKNVIVNGIVLAENGQKMSKRLKNYPDPNLVVEKYGADALRYYLLSSPVMKAENLNFSEKGVEEVLKKFILTLWNVYSFLAMKEITPTPFNKEGRAISYPSLVRIGEIPPLKKEVGGISKKSSNLLDQWILSELNILIGEVNKQMRDYDLTKASRPLREFVDKLSNWYVRRSRKRFGSVSTDDAHSAFQTLRCVLTEYAKLLAPFMPFLAEEIYKNLTDEESVHLADYPQADEKMINGELSKSMNFARQTVTLGLAARAKNSIKVRQPLRKLEIRKLGNWEIENSVPPLKKGARGISGLEMKSELLELIKDELNVKKIEFVDKIIEEENWVYEEDGEIKIGLETKITDELKREGFARELTRHIQAMRKEVKYNRDDIIFVKYNFVGENKNIKKVFEEWGNYLKKECLAEEIGFTDEIVEGEFDLVKELKLGEWRVRIGVGKN